MSDLYKNATYIRSLHSEQFPDLGAKLHEAIMDIASRTMTLAQQTNSNLTGQPQPPPAVNGVKVTGQGGYLHVAITDGNALYRGVQYFAEHADNPYFTDPHIVPMGASRNVSIPVGNQTRYVRVYSAYGSTGPSAPVYHGSEVAPLPVSGGGNGPGPLFLSSQGSGTGTPGQGLTGPGVVPFRSDTGVPPVRGI